MREPQPILLVSVLLEYWVGGVPEGFNLGVLVGFLEGGREEGRGRVLCSLFQPGIWELCTGGIESGCGESRLQSRDCESRPQSQGLREFRGGEVRPLPARGCLGAWPGAGGRASGGEILGLYVWSCIIWALGVFPQLFQELRALEIYLLPDCEISPSLTPPGAARVTGNHSWAQPLTWRQDPYLDRSQLSTHLRLPPPILPHTPPPQLCPSSAKALFQASQVSPPIDTPEPQLTPPQAPPPPPLQARSARSPPNPPTAATATAPTPTAATRDKPADNQPTVCPSRPAHRLLY